jgi:hypothetical protein
MGCKTCQKGGNSLVAMKEALVPLTLLGARLAMKKRTKKNKGKSMKKKNSSKKQKTKRNMNKKKMTRRKRR